MTVPSYFQHLKQLHGDLQEIQSKADQIRRSMTRSGFTDLKAVVVVMDEIVKDLHLIEKSLMTVRDQEREARTTRTSGKKEKT